MRLGPNIYYKCPTCQTIRQMRGWSSGNNIGAVFYSDGKQEAPMLPDSPCITRCKKCQSVFWLEPNKIGESIGGSELLKNGRLARLDRDLIPPEWENADYVGSPSIDDHFMALTLPDTKKSDEKYIRERIWWGYNDRFRKGIDMFDSEDDGIRWWKNCKELITLYDQTDQYERLLTAEVYRHLGEFERSKEIINSVDAADIEWRKEKMLAACNEQNRKVVRLN